jgi:hypothetical protein
VLRIYGYRADSKPNLSLVRGIVGMGVVDLNADHSRRLSV